MAEPVSPPPVPSARVAAYQACTPRDRADAIAQLVAARNAIDAELLDVVTAADRQRDWKVDGATAMAPWLVGTCHVSLATARTGVRTGNRLAALPHLRDAFSEGLVSWDQLVPTTTYATAETDERLARELPGWTAAEAERRAAIHRKITSRQTADRTHRRGLTWRADATAGGCFYRGFLPDTEAALVNAALTRAAQTAGPDPLTGVWAPFESRCADALVDQARTAIARDPGPDPALVVVHVPAGALDGHANGLIGDIPVSPETIRRLLGDTPIELNVDGPHGTCIGIGRPRRTIPRWLRRRIHARDHTCRFPGYSHPIRHIHHITHWSDGGPTNSWNLIGLCWDHHHLIHEPRWTITGTADSELTITTPYGATLPRHPPPLHPDTRHKIAHATGIHLPSHQRTPDPARGP
ncbi:MAG TPA: DUF222 domain-containing protein [Acidimicrobiales bacterium]|nr:DUF222 domain-containing protein [Acidimicrobiales bacterium]